MTAASPHALYEGRVEHLRSAPLHAFRYRLQFVYLDLDDPLAANVQRIRDAHHSRFPVVHGGLKNIEGIVLAKAFRDADTTNKRKLISVIAKAIADAKD